MIPLEYVSTKDIIDHGQYIKSMTKGHYDCGSDILIQYNVENFADLQAHIASGNPDFQKQELFSLLDQTMEACDAIDEYNALRGIYFFDAFKKANINEEAIKKTDAQVTCSALLLASPLNPNSCLLSRIKDISIADAKNLLGTVNTRGTNMFVEKINNCGPRKAKIIASAIGFYDEQLIRCAKEHPECDGNLFIQDFNEKSRIVYEQLPDILGYLICNGDNFIWGYLNNKQKMRLLECINPKNSDELKIKIRLVEMLANYLTLNELEEDVIQKRTLNRFIKK